MDDHSKFIDRYDQFSEAVDTCFSIHLAAV